jgi:hypothetical protein
VRPGSSFYRIELTACFVVTINEVVEGPHHLTKEQLVDVIEQNWWWISGSTDVLLESSWELEEFEELRPETA